MKSSNILYQASAIALVSLLAGCSTWQSMDRQEKGTAVGATGGAIVGAAVGGPIGAAVGAGVGGYTGHYEANEVAGGTRSTAIAPESASPTVRSAQQALNDRGYNAGPADGVWGPNTEAAVRQFQQAQRLQSTGTLDKETLSALGVSR
jgi:Putative peptidoglycan binding domain